MTTHTLLEELRDLGVQLSTDGTNLTIDAPRGVMTPALWEQLREQKQELITQIGLADTPLQSVDEPDEDERLHAFASTVSHMVDMLGGPGGVRITRHAKGLKLAEHVRSIRPPYQPRTLPVLPRLACPFQEMVIKREKDGDHQVAGKCLGKPLPHGWCANHGHSHELLCLGALLGYPEVVWEHYAIGAGVARWEAYAERVSHRLARDIASIRARFGVPIDG